METNLAVLIDFENIAAGTEKEGLGRFDVDALMTRVKDKGRILVARSYADWGRFARFKQSLLTANVTMYELTSHGMQDKNRADIAMVVDALELAFTKDYIDTFVVVSGDSDFTPLVLKMREMNKRVIGCGTRSSTSRLLIQACDEFFFYDSIVQAKRQRPAPSARTASGEQMSLKEAFELLVDTLQGMLREEPEPPLASVVKSTMLRKSPDFSETDYNFSSFARFLEAAQEKSKVRIFRDQKSGGYRIDMPESGGRSERAPAAAPERRTERAEDDGEAGTWIDPYAPKGSAHYIEVLGEEGYNPLAAPTRLAVIDHVEQIVKERKSKRRRINGQFVQDDVRKRMKKTHPDVPYKAIRNVFNGLMRAQIFMHRDGNAVRTMLAPFHLEKDGPSINKALVNVYLDLLHEQGVPLDDPTLLAQLFYGNAERSREIEEVVAWLHASEVDDEEVNLDDLLEVDESTEEAAAEAPAEEAEAPAEEAPAEEPAAAVEGAEAEEPAEEPAPKPKKKPATRARKKKEAAPEKAEKAEKKADDEADEAPKKKTTRRRRTRKSEDVDDIDALLTSD